eukprot:11793_1
MYTDAVNITADANYLNAGTVEFLVDQQGRHFFIESEPTRPSGAHRHGG